MEDKKDLQEFDLDDILNEFQDTSEAGGDLGELTGEMAELVSDWDSGETPAIPAVEIRTPVSMDTGRINELIAEVKTQEAAPDDNAHAEAPASPMDTTRMNEIIAEILEQGETVPAPAAADTVRIDGTELPGIETVRGDSVSDDATIRMDAILEDPTVRLDPVSPDPTIRMESL